ENLDKSGVLEVSQIKIKAISELSINETFTSFGDISKVKEWSSFRPYRYNSTPLIGKIESLPNFYLNVGHGSLGWTNSLASGKIVADEISENHHKDFKFLSDDLKNIFTN
ncbi:MAG: FAD-dependent oxidoreductase, partial [Alphaproteobacteria bacterium]